MEMQQLKSILEAALLAAGEPVSLSRLVSLFEKEEAVTKKQIEQALLILQEEAALRGIRLQEVASGYCFTSATDFSPWLKKLWPEKKLRYSRAFLETLAIIAYKQPVTRADIEVIRGVSVNPQLIKLLLDQEWIQVLGQREVPGRPTLYGTTTQFLDHFNLKSLTDLPPLPALETVKEPESAELSAA